MTLKEVLAGVFGPEGRYTPLVIIALWAYMAWMIGDVVAILIGAALLISLIAAVHAALKKSSREHYVSVSIKGSIITTTYSLATALTLFTLLPYIIVGQGLWNIYVLTTIILLPILTTFFFMIHYLHHIIVDLDQRFWISLLVGFAKAAFSTALIIAILIVGANFIHNQTMNTLANQISSQEEQLSTPTLGTTLEVVDELSAFAIERLNNARDEAAEADVACKVCDLSLTFDHAQPAAVALIENTWSLQLLEDIDARIARLPETVTQEQVDALITTIDMSEPYLVERQPPAPKLVFTLNQLLKETTTLQTTQATIPLDTIPNSPLTRSAAYTILHTADIQEGLSLATALSTVVEQETTQPAYIRMLYNNREQEESLKSKYFRYLLLQEFTPHQP